ncbi:MAG: serine hydrolase [Deltaproteobacteria bacterium]|nr:MAG: serine hydrolase [Deltaproteobacteria bacterium]
MTEKIRNLLIRGLKQEVYPGAVLLVARGEDVVLFHNVGNRALIPKPLPMEKETIFDLASLTKPLATTLAIMKLVDQGLLDLDIAISSLIEPFPWKDKANLTPRLLLNHSSGLPDWKPFHLELMQYPTEERKPVVRRLIMEGPLHDEPKKVSLYSDLGFMLLEWIIEVITGQDLSSFLNSQVYQPLGLKDLYLDQINADPPKQKDVFAATEYCPWRMEIIQGHVHDENAHALGGYSGHAGLFGTARDVFTLTNRLIKIFHGYSSGQLKTETVRTFLSRQEIVPGSTWALGWDTPAEKESSSGNYFSSSSVGHTGFTGTSVWIDLEKDITVIFLTNRIHPNRSNEKIRDLRPRLHDVIMREFGYGR